RMVVTIPLRNLERFHKTIAMGQIMKIGIAEVAIASLTVILSVGASWVTVKETQASSVARISSMEDDLTINVRLMTEMEKRMDRADTDIALLREKDRQLEKATDTYSESLNGLRKVLSELNVTLGRMDERLIGIERGIKD